MVRMDLIAKYLRLQIIQTVHGLLEKLSKPPLSKSSSKLGKNLGLFSEFVLGKLRKDFPWSSYHHTLKPSDLIPQPKSFSDAEEVAQLKLVELAGSLKKPIDPAVYIPTPLVRR